VVIGTLFVVVVVVVVVVDGGVWCVDPVDPGFCLALDVILSFCNIIQWYNGDSGPRVTPEVW